MRIRSIIASAVLAVSGVASAAGPYDGIYQSATDSQQFYSVHQNGSHMIIGGFGTMPAYVMSENITLNGRRFVPQRGDLWNLTSGVINSGIVTVSGEALFGACYGSITVAFDATGANFRYNYLSNTAEGNAQGIDCPAIFRTIVNQNNGMARAQRVF